MKMINFSNKKENDTRKIKLSITIPFWISILIIVGIIYWVVK
ncbi:hypothetical protein [Companilactobacillus sp. DQM5]